MRQDNMGKVEVTYTDREKLLENTRVVTEKVLYLFQKMREEIEGDKEKYESALKEIDLSEYNLPNLDGNNVESFIRQGLEIEETLAQMKVTISGEEVDISTKELLSFRNMMMEVVAQFVSMVEEIKERKKVEVTTEESTQGVRKGVKMKFSEETPPPPMESPDSVLDELKKLSQVKVAQAQVSKDLMETQIKSAGDTLALIPNERDREHIKKLQKQGKLLHGTLEGLSGGSAYFKVFTIALAQTLNEQSKFYQNDREGVPVDLVGKFIGGEVDVEKTSFTIKNEKRKTPFVLVSYEELAKKIKGSVRGGKDIEDIKNYIDSLKDKYYLLDMGDHYGGVPYITKVLTIFAKNTGKELGCVLNLSPQYSYTTRGYSAVRADTIQLLGGGQQRDITMNLVETLLYVRGVGKEYRIKKEELLQKIATGKRYITHKKDREEHFREAIQKAINAKILLGGVEKKGGLKGYREERNPGGEIISVFTFNPDYLKGEEIPTPEEQTGE